MMANKIIKFIFIFYFYEWTIITERMAESINTAGLIWLGSRSQTLLKTLFTLF